MIGNLIYHLQQRFAHRNIYLHQFDLTKHVNAPADVIMSRDVFFHLPKNQTRTALHHHSMSGSRYFITTTFPNSTDNDAPDTTRGWFPINVQQYPYSIGTPLELIREAGVGCLAGYNRYVGLWELPLAGYGCDFVL